MSLVETTFATVCYPIFLVLKFTNAVLTLRGKEHLIHTFLSSEKTDDETIQIRLMELQHFAVIARGCLSSVLIHSGNSAIKTLFTWSGGPRSSGVSFFCFVSSRA